MRSIALLVCLALGCAKGSPSGGDGGLIIDGGDGADAAPTADADTCSAEPCALLEQCGCGEVQVCDLDSEQFATAGTACRDVTSPGTELANCTVSSECAGGYACLGGGGLNQCRKYCDEDGDCGDGGHCILTIVYTDDEGMQQPVPGVNTCTKSCAPEKASDNACPDDPQFGCRILFDDPNDTPDDGDEYFLTDCGRAPPSGGGDDATCTAHTGCAPGFGCTTFGADRRCKQTCVYNVDGAPGPRVCSAGTCLAFTDTPTIGTTEYGYCD
jgi:hypothetical protein